MTTEEFWREFNKRTEHTGRERYISELRDVLNDMSELELVICRAWDATFGLPGYGSADYVRITIERARQALVAIRQVEGIKTVETFTK